MFGAAFLINPSGLVAKNRLALLEFKQSYSLFLHEVLSSRAGVVALGKNEPR